MTRDEEKLLAELRSKAQSNRPPPLRRTAGGFVLDYGCWYVPCALPAGLEHGAPKQCFKNAMNLTGADTSLVYCEGYVIGKSQAVHLHAWVTDGQGRAIDSTYREPGRAYAGVPFKTEWLLLRALRNKAVICVLDDWEHEWPILGDLGDRPEEWREAQGYGLSRIVPANEKA